MDLFKDLNALDKKKIFFIHLNHTNPALQKNSPAQKEIIKMGFGLAQEGQIIKL
jgi:pyrroloquinoline quinone biosynthesis protein B